MRALIVGGGIIGATLAHELTKYNVDVVLLEGRYFTYGATGRATGSITTQQRHKALVRLALETISIWRGFRKEAEELKIPFANRFMCDESPHIAIALSNEEFRKLRELANLWTSVGLQVKVTDGEGAREFIPELRADAIKGAVITFADLKAMPHPYTWARIAAARINGAKTYTYEHVVKVMISDNDVRVVTSTGKEFKADVLVVAAGAGSLGIIDYLRDEVRVKVRSMYAGGFVTEPFKYVMKPTLRIFSENFRFLQTVRREFVATIDNMGFENPHLSTEDSLELLERASTLIVKLMPNFAYVNILRSWGAFVDYTDDGLPIVGWSPRYSEKVYYLFGLNDYGLSTGPAIATRAAREIARGVSDDLLSIFRPGRSST